MTVKSQAYMTAEIGMCSFLFRITPRISKPPLEPFARRIMPEPIPSRQPAIRLLSRGSAESSSKA